MFSSFQFNRYAAALPIAALMSSFAQAAPLKDDHVPPPSIEWSAATSAGDDAQESTSAEIRRMKEEARTMSAQMSGVFIVLAKGTAKETNANGEEYTLEKLESGLQSMLLRNNTPARVVGKVNAIPNKVTRTLVSTYVNGTELAEADLNTLPTVVRNAIERSLVLGASSNMVAVLEGNSQRDFDHQ